MVSSPDPSLSHEEKRSGEPIQISGYRTLLRQCNLATFNTENELKKKKKKKYGYSMEMNKFSVEMKCYIILSDFIGSYNFWVMSPRNSASFTRPVSRREARAGWAQGPISASMCLVKQFI